MKENWFETRGNKILGKCNLRRFKRFIADTVLFDLTLQNQIVIIL